MEQAEQTAALPLDNGLVRCRSRRFVHGKPDYLIDLSAFSKALDDSGFSPIRANCRGDAVWKCSLKACGDALFGIEYQHSGTLFDDRRVIQNGMKWSPYGLHHYRNR